MRRQRKGRSDGSQMANIGERHVEQRNIAERDCIVHEVALHQLELEVQNHTLRDAQVLLETSRATYAELYDCSPVGHITLDAAGTIRRLNLACAALLGRPRRFLEGRPLPVLLDPSSRRALDAHLRASLAGHELTTVELTVLVNGLPRPVELLTAPRVRLGNNPGAEVVCHSGMIDISQRRRDDERREELFRREREARLLAESASQVKEDFLAIVSHELRTPLTPMLLWLRALRTEGEGESVRTRALTGIEAGIKVQVAMIDDLVDVARGRHGKLHVERHPMDVLPVVAAAIEAVAPSAAAKLITVTLELTQESARVLGDAIRLQQVAQNLLMNAIKFTAEGGRVVVSLSVTAAVVVLVVSDDGEGIDAESLEDVFEPFRQHDRTQERRHGGLGLGLAIVRQLVAEHDGLVRAHSGGRGRGSSFTVTLPRLDVGVLPIDKAIGLARPVASKDQANALDGLRVVVVEDQEDTREAMAVILSTAGAKVITAASADEGLQAVRETTPDVLVSDIGLPGEDGFVLIGRLRAWEAETASRRIPAIALTAHAGAHNQARALLAGFDRHIAKPIAFEDLVATIRAVAPRRTG